MLQLQRYEPQLNELAVRIKIISFDRDSLGKAYVRQTGLKWPLLLDDERQLYKAYGTSRGSWSSIYGISSILKYLKLIFGGTLPGKPGRDWRQLGGDVLVGPDGVIRLHHVSKAPHDRPAIEAILQVVRGQA